MDKHEQAQRFAEIMLQAHYDNRAHFDKLDAEIAEVSWLMVDAMQAEADKRKEKGFPDAVKDAEK